LREQLEKLVQEMIERGILYEDAKREFERVFIQRALARSGGSLLKASKILGLHRNTMTRKITEYRIKRRGIA
jgi:two-component system nitrogen regulation response regulator GlnG